jgi:hypothetical protein
MPDLIRAGKTAVEVGVQAVARGAFCRGRLEAQATVAAGEGHPFCAANQPASTQNSKTHAWSGGWVIWVKIHHDSGWRSLT